MGRLDGIAKRLVSLDSKEICQRLEELTSPEPEGPGR